MKRRQIFRAQAAKSQSGSSSRRFVSSGPVLPFNPASIPGCQLWLDAADTSSVALNSSSSVLTWIDKSGNGYHMNTIAGSTIWSGSPEYPTIGTSINGLQTLKFSPQAGLKQSTTLDGVKNLFWVGRIAAPTGSGSGPNYFLLGHDSVYDWSANVYGDAFLYPPIVPSGINNASASLFTNDPRAVTNTAFSNVYLPSAPNVSLLSVSGITGTTRYQGICYDRATHIGWCGDLAEVLIFSTALTTIQRQKVEGYLAWKWGVQSTLPSNHPYKGIAPTYEEPVFTPTLISGSQLWLDGADQSSFILSGSNITSWSDKSGNTRNATQFNTGFATYDSIQKRVVITPGGQLFSSVPAGTFSTGVSAFIVFQKFGANQDYDTLVNRTNTGNSPAPFDTYLKTRIIGKGDNNTLLLQSSDRFFFRNTVTTLYYFNIPATLVWNESINGESPTSLSQYEVNGTPVYSDTGNYIYIGTRGDKFTTANVYIYEILFYNTTLTTSQRQRVEGYLAQKWGLHSSLPANHPYKTIAPTGIPRSITVQSLSVLFNSGSLSVPQNSALTLGTNNHTFEFWLYQTSRNFYDVPFIYGNTAGNATNNYYMNLGQYTGVLIGNGSPGGWSLNMANGLSLPALNTWAHYALVRNGNTFTLYLNGTNVASTTLSISIPAQGGVMAIGGLNSGGNTISGYMANFRFVNGTAVYTSNFTPPTAPLTAIPNTQVLLQGFVDRSPNAFTVTSTGGVTLSTLSPFV